MHADRVLLFTDIEGSTQLTEQLGDVAASALWTEHDRVARRLMRKWRGQEIDKSDGFLILFDRVDDAVCFAIEMHGALAGLTPPLRARAGIHRGDVVERQNTSDDVSRGAKPLELDGVGKAVASRMMSIAKGGQTLLSAHARAALGDGAWKVQSHGHWRMKGLAEPIELFEVGDGGVPFIPPVYSEKSFRVVRLHGSWTAVADLPHNIPAERDSFVGRDEALEALATISRDERRLVTILGIGGIGKTRLATRYASTWLGDYPGGVWFCDLSPATSVEGIVLAVAQGLNVPLGKAEPIPQLGAAIAGRGQCLVILDNFEQVARHAEATVGKWLERAPDARFLVTSREVLGIRGEETFVLSPLSSESAIRLFEVRAKAANPAFVPGASDTATTARLVELLDRLPLAIELAAARVRVMSPRVVLERMDQRFKVLASSSNRRERQATLRATLDWSWELLSKPEQAALAQLSVFEGGFSLEAAEAVLDLPKGNNDNPPWVPDVLQALIEKSLLRDVGGQRFEMLRSVQDYASERLREPGCPANSESAVATAHRRHWTYFASLDETTVAAQRCIERENLIAATRRALAGDDVDSAVGALAGAGAALQLTGPFRTTLELVQIVESATALTAAQRATVHRVAGAALSVLGETERAIARFEAGLQQANVAGDVTSIIRIRCLATSFGATHSTAEQSIGELEEAMSLAIASGDLRLRFRVWSAMGALYLRTGQLPKATQCYDEAIEIAQSLGNKHWQGGMYGNLGFIAQSQGRLADARTHLEAALACANEIGDRQWEGNARCNLGLLLYQLGDADAAAKQLASALALARSVGYRPLEATVLCNLGIVAESQADSGRALDCYADAVTIGSALGDPRADAQFRGYFALLLARLGRVAESELHFTRALEAATDGSDPFTLAMLHCQRAIAAGERGDESRRQELLALAEDFVDPRRLTADFELSKAFTMARRARAKPN